MLHIISKALLFGLLLCSGALFAQSNPPTFNGTMSRENLDTYLGRSGFFDDINDGCYYKFRTPTCFDKDKTMMLNIKPFYLARAGTTWGNDDWADFTDENEVVDKIHNEVNSGIIVEGYISEYMNKQVAPPGIGSINIIIPAYVKTAFGYTGSATYFDWREMKYSDVTLPNPTCPGPHVWCSPSGFDGITPNVTQIMTKMFYYFAATKLIDAGYEGLHIGQWFLLNDEDAGNVAMWDLFSKIRTYANANARRHLVVINGSASTDPGFLSIGTDANDDNNRPYLNYVPGSNSNRLLFDFHVNTVEWSEDGYVANSNSPFYKSASDPRYERLIKIPANFDKFQFGGLIAQSNWNWSPAQQVAIPNLFHLDVGGPNLASEEGNLAYNDPGYPNDFRTWGWGGELNHYMFTSLPYRRHLLHVVAHQIRERNSNSFLMQPLRGPVSSNYFKFSAPYTTSPYNYNYPYQAPNEIGYKFRCNDDESACSVALTAGEMWCYPPQIAFKIESQIKEIWDKTREIYFCTPTTYSTDFTEIQGFNSPDFPRFLMDVDGDGDKDIVGIGATSIKVAKFAGGAFQASTTWTGNKITFNQGWNATAHYRSYGDFNGDGKADLIGCGPGGVWVGISNGTNAFTFTNWSTDFANSTNNSSEEWANSKSVRKVADVNNDGKDDLVGFGNASTYRAISSGTAFGAKAVWHWDFSNSGAYNNTDHIRTVADVDGDGDDDLIAFGQSCIFAGINNNGTISSSTTLLCNMCKNQGWSTASHTRTLADIDGDGKLDIVGFGEEGILVSKNTNWAFSPVEYWTYQLGSNARAGSWTNTSHTRFLTDVTGDGKADVVAFGQNGLDVIPSTGTYLGHIFHYNSFGNAAGVGGWSNTKHVRTAINFDPADSRSELICFGYDKVYIMNNCNNATFLPPPNSGDEPLDEQGQIEERQDMTTLDETLKVYPNPAFDVLFVEMGAFSNCTGLRITNALGQVLIANEGIGKDESLLRLPIGQLPPGVYNLVLTNGEQILANRRFVKA
jgi:hypothetical protein